MRRIRVEIRRGRLYRVACTTELAVVSSAVWYGTGAVIRAVQTAAYLLWPLAIGARKVLACARRVVGGPRQGSGEARLERSTHLFAVEAHRRASFRVVGGLDVIDGRTGHERIEVLNARVRASREPTPEKEKFFFEDRSEEWNFKGCVVLFMLLFVVKAPVLSRIYMTQRVYNNVRGADVVNLIVAFIWG